MKQKIKEFSKKYLVGFIIGSILFGTLGVYAVTYFPGLNTTYDNSDSGMTSTNVQDAVDELYNVCVPPKAGDQIIEDGNLTKDEYECRYFFTGANPNNYITFNDEEAGWRIISVECDGTIKIMRYAGIVSKAWDTSYPNGSSNWAKPASLNTYLNGEYYNGLNSTTQSQIVAKEFSIGAVTWDNNDLADQVNDENSIKWSGKIALPTVSEYLRTNSNTNCKTFKLNNNNYNTCKGTTWLTTNTNWWTLSANDASNHVYYNGGYSYASLINKVRPTLYLSSDIKIAGGTGTQTDPYTIE